MTVSNSDFTLFHNFIQSSALQTGEDAKMLEDSVELFQEISHPPNQKQLD